MRNSKLSWIIFSLNRKIIKKKRERENEEKKCRPSVKIYRTIICEKKKGIVTSKTYLYHSSNCWSFSTISDAFFTLEHRSRVEEDDFTFYLWYLIGRNATRTADIDRRTRLSDWFVSFPQRKDPPWWNNLTSKRKGKRVKKKKWEGKWGERAGARYHERS